MSFDESLQGLVDIPELSSPFEMLMNDSFLYLMMYLVFDGFDVPFEK
ncbi:MAG: hypothetical protein WCJ45_08515 [bacterium]